jgi:hypothetical protein
MILNPADIIQSGVAEARAAMAEAATELNRQRTRIDALETALNRMVLAHENLVSDTEGKYPSPDAGCIECTVGTVPNRYNTGLCAYHAAKRLLGQS